MHKTFYASGFIFHLPSEQILLQQQQSSSSPTLPWLLFEKEYLEHEQPEVAFKDVLFELLGIKINTINPIYSYFNETTLKRNSLMYGIVSEKEEFSPKNGYTFRWFSFKEVLKIQATKQTKHDIVVGQRVIEAMGRRERGEHTF